MNLRVVKALQTCARTVLRTVRMAVTATLHIACVASPTKVAVALIRRDASAVDTGLIADWNAFPKQI